MAFDDLNPANSFITLAAGWSERLLPCSLVCYRELFPALGQCDFPSGTADTIIMTVRSEHLTRTGFASTRLHHRFVRPSCPTLAALAPSPLVLIKAGGHDSDNCVKVGSHPLLLLGGVLALPRG